MISKARRPVDEIAIYQTRAVWAFLSDLRIPAGLRFPMTPSGIPSAGTDGPIQRMYICRTFTVGQAPLMCRDGDQQAVISGLEPNIR